MFGSVKVVGVEAKVSDVEISYFFCCFFRVPFCLIGLPRSGDAFLVSLKAAFPDCIPFPCLAAIEASLFRFCCMVVAGYFDFFRIEGLLAGGFFGDGALVCVFTAAPCFFGCLWVLA